jgi:hypothetical protein
VYAPLVIIIGFPQITNRIFAMYLTLAFVAILIIVTALYNYFTDPLSSVPGPFVARLTRLWELVQVRKGAFETTNIELHRKYGMLPLEI